MDFSSMFDVISLVCGGYILLTWFKLRAAGRLFPNNLLIPRDKSPQDCLDQAGFILYISPRLLTVGIIVGLSGLAGLANAWFQFYGFWVSEGIIAVCLIALVWYCVCNARAAKKYW